MVNVLAGNLVRKKKKTTAAAPAAPAPAVAAPVPAVARAPAAAAAVAATASPQLLHNVTLSGRHLGDGHEALFGAYHQMASQQVNRFIGQAPEAMNPFAAEAMRAHFSRPFFL